MVLPAARSASSPSTRTHQPSPPTVPSSKPPMVFSKLSFAYFKISSSKLPGCNQTDLTPADFASANAVRVTDGGVTNDRAVKGGSERAFGEATVAYDLEGRSIDGLDGLIGVTLSAWAWYHANTVQTSVFVVLGRTVMRASEPKLCPVLCGTDHTKEWRGEEPLRSRLHGMLS